MTTKTEDELTEELIIETVKRFREWEKEPVQTRREWVDIVNEIWDDYPEENSK